MSTCDDRLALLSALADGTHPLELRCFPRNGSPRKAFCVDPRDADDLAERLTREGHELFVGALPRLGADGELQRRYASSATLFTDSDTARSVAKHAMFEPAPTCVVLTGGMDGFTPRRQCYWHLRERVPADEISAHVRRLAVFLAADMASTDAARVLRLPGSVNAKTGIVARVERLTDDRYSLDEIVGELPDVPAQLVAGTGCGEQVALTGPAPFGERHEHLKDAAVRLVRGGFTDERLIERLLATVFAVTCEPLPVLAPHEVTDLARWAVSTRIAGRERELAGRELPDDGWWVHGD
jgi:hypothetical protein